MARPRMSARAESGRSQTVQYSVTGTLASRTATELRAQRLRRWQQISLAPQNHKQVLAAMFGTLEIDRPLELPRL
eukprot:3232462-Pyramimonas_sp.AAC.1